MNLFRELGLRIGGSLLGLSLVGGLGFYGHTDLPGSSIFDSTGGILIGTIVLMEVLFIGAISYFYVFDK